MSTIKYVVLVILLLVPILITTLIYFEIQVFKDEQRRALNTNLLFMQSQSDNLRSWYYSINSTRQNQIRMSSMRDEEDN